MDPFFDALKDNPFAMFLFREFKMSGGNPKTMQCLIEEQEEFLHVKALLQEQEEERVK